MISNKALTLTNRISKYRLIHSYVYKMDRAYLRHLTDTEKFDITFHYRNPDYKVDRPFNFSRQATEPVSAFLSRIVTSVEKIINRKNKRKKGVDEPLTLNQVTAGLLLENIAVSDDVLCKDVFKSGNNVKLKIMEKEYVIVINSPYVNAIALPNSILANFPVYPSKFETIFAVKSLCEFIWQVSKDGQAWKHVGAGYIYTPTNADVGSYLKLGCIPKNEELEGPLTEQISEVQVDASPGFCPFENRHKFATKICKDGEFRVVSYNILADLYCDSDFSRTELYPYCPPYALNIDYRKQLILKELIGYNGDIMCLQEVDRKVFSYDIEPVLSSLGYRSNFTLKSGVAEGLACFYRNNRFSLLEKDFIVLSDELPKNDWFADIWSKVSQNDNLKDRILQRTTTVQITVIKSIETGNIVLVANTHLYFHPDADHIRLLQGCLCICYIQEIFKKLKVKYESENVSVIFCGDFNSVPACGIYQLYTSGHVAEDLNDWQSNKDEAVVGLSVHQPFKLASACGTPKYTNFTAGFADCLDYIFYDTSKLNVTQVIPLPTHEELIENTALPSIVFPSDHIALVADLKFL